MRLGSISLKFDENVYSLKRPTWILVIAGSGKTLAFGIPMIHSILEWKKSPEVPVVEDAKPCAQVESLYLPSPADLEESTLEEDEMDAKGDDTWEEDGDKLGCVQVIDDAKFDFEQMAEQQRQPSVSPLLGLVLTPTRELAVQVKHHIDAAAKFTGESAGLQCSVCQCKC